MELTYDEERALRLVKLSASGRGYTTLGEFYCLDDSKGEPYMKHINSLIEKEIIKKEHGEKIFIRDYPLDLSKSIW